MKFLHFSIIPSLVFLISIALTFILNKKEFNQYFKLYFLGILAGLIFLLILSFLKIFYFYSASHITILLKSILVDGLIFLIFYSFSLFFIFEYLRYKHFLISWSMTSIFAFAYAGGIFTVINLFQSINNFFPNYPAEYLITIPLLLFISIFIARCLFEFLNSNILIYKILWASFGILVCTFIIALYTYLEFYDYFIRYIYIILFIGFGIYFELFEFKSFRLQNLNNKK